MPLLADQILAQRLLSSDESTNALEASLRSAHAFELAPDFAAAADQLRGTRPSAFDGIIHLCRLPYESCWLEVRQRDRDSFVNGDGNPLDHDSALDRIGVLVTAPKDRPGFLLMQLFWSFMDGKVTTSHFDALVSLEQTPSLKVVYRPGTKEMIHGMYPPREHAAAERMFSRFALHVGRLRGHDLAFASVESPLYQALIERADHDWAGEPQYWLAALALLNARNVVDREEVDMTDKNRRRRRIGSRKPPLLSFTRCVISARLRARMTEAGGEAEGGGVRAHFVRGHFKCRETGIFWWTPFLRGNQALGLVSKRYEVR